MYHSAERSQSDNSNTTDYVGKILHLLENPLYGKLAMDSIQSMKWRTTLVLKKSSIQNISEQL